MPIKIKNCEESYLTGAVVPNLGKSTPASYKFIIDKVKQLCDENNLKIVEAKYKSTSDQAYASGIYLLESKVENVNYDIVFAWSSSYTRISKFQCAFGIKFKNSPYPDNYVISDDAVAVVKRYKNNPEAETENVIKKQFSNWESFCHATVFELEKMSKIVIDKFNIARIIGSLYFEDLINNKQLTLIKDRVLYGESISYRALLAGVTSTMYDLHPKTWLETQAGIYLNFTSEINPLSKCLETGATALAPIPTESLDLSKSDSKQLDLLSSIEEIEKERIVKNESAVEELQKDIEVKGDNLDISTESTEEKYFDFDL